MIPGHSDRVKSEAGKRSYIRSVPSRKTVPGKLFPRRHLITVHAIADADQTSTGNVDAHALRVVCYVLEVRSVQLEFRIARRTVLAMVFESVEILVALATHLAAIRLLLLHADGARVGNASSRIYYREGTIRVLLELLILMTMLLVVFETVLVLVSLLAANDRALEWFDLLADESADARKTIE